MSEAQSHQNIIANLNSGELRTKFTNIEKNLQIERNIYEKTVQELIATIRSCNKLEEEFFHCTDLDTKERLDIEIMMKKSREIEAAKTERKCRDICNKLLRELTEISNELEARLQKVPSKSNLSEFKLPEALPVKFLAEIVAEIDKGKQFRDQNVHDNSMTDLDENILDHYRDELKQFQTTNAPQEEPERSQRAEELAQAIRENAEQIEMLAVKELQRKSQNVLENPAKSSRKAVRFAQVIQEILPEDGEC
jgi:hypothetical protein